MHIVVTIPDGKKIVEKKVVNKHSIIVVFDGDDAEVF